MADQLTGTHEEIMANIIGFYTGLLASLSAHLHSEGILDGRVFAENLRIDASGHPNYAVLANGLANAIEQRVDRAEATGERPKFTVVSNDE